MSHSGHKDTTRASRRIRVRSRRATSQIEVLIIGGLLLLTLGVTLPTLSSARRAARSITCQQILGSFGAATQIYVNDNQDWIPGVNTSGVAIRAKKFAADADPDILHHPDVPVQSWDWMSPLAQILGHELPANRAARWHYLWTTFRCPQNDATAIPYGVSGAPDGEDFLDYEWPACSYLMPSYFSYWGSDFEGYDLAPYEGVPQFWVEAKTVPPSWEVQPPATFQSRDSAIQSSAADKLLIADGTRYLPGNQILDFDIGLDPPYFGAFTTSGGWMALSTAYGVLDGSTNWDGDTVCAGSPSDGGNLPLTYRHDSPVPVVSQPRYDGQAQTHHGVINAVMFDGHVEWLNDQASREVSLWYPGGSTVTTDYCGGMSTLPGGYEIP